MKAINLKCEYLDNPIGIDIVTPRLMWVCDGGTKQTAYEIVTYKNGVKDYESGLVQSSSMCYIYEGTLKSRDIIEWQVRLYDENGEAGDWSDKAIFEMGLLAPSDWQAKWIAGDYKINKKYRYPVDCFKRNFTALGVKRARLYISACGIYEAKINGMRVGDFVLAPGHTDYAKRIQYQVYDVTDILRSGGNILEITLADGWYRGAQGAWGHTYLYGQQTKIIAQLELYDEDGKITIISTDNSFAWSNDGSILFADLKEGEVIDANKLPSYSGNAKEINYKANLTASNNYPVTKHERFTPTLITTPSGKKVLDFGQNISGFIGFKLNAVKGQKLFLRMGEAFDKDGEFTQKNIQLAMKKDAAHNTHVVFAENGLVKNLKQSVKERITPLQMLEYICKNGENEYETTFALYGFRYALVETDIDFKPEDFYSVAVYSAFDTTGKFECSNELINKFVDCTLWSEKSNSADVPTDCPTRERSGWSGDAQIFFDTASYLTSYQPFARKWIRDLNDRQANNGKYHQIAPKGGEDFWMNTMNGSVGWACAGVLIPYRMWKKYGDEKIIADYYEQMAKYGRFMISRQGGFTLLRKPVHIKKYGKYLANRGQSYGEWAEPQEVCAFKISDFIFPHPEESTAYTYFTLKHLAEIAKHLGKNEDAELFTKYSEGARLAYRELVKKKGFSLDTDRQAKLVRPLFMGLLDDKQTEFAKERLVKAMENYNWRLGTGFLSTPFILRVLQELDVEYAYKLLENEECPGWLFMPKNGATTIWESWEGTQSHGAVASLNHYSKGACVEWLFDTVCGIKVAGENHFEISPLPGGTLTHAKAEYNSIYGKVVSGWEKKDGKVSYTIEIPANCTAKITLPDGISREVAAGVYELCTTI